MAGRKKVEDAPRTKRGPSRDRVITMEVPEELSWFFSEEVMEHFLAARREVLLALKCMIDHTLETIEKKSGKVERAKALRIKVE
jgi:hypothetical protein